MSYTVFVSREPVFENGPGQITCEEWVRLAEEDPEFEASNELSDEEGGVYRWMPHPDHPAFDYYRDLGVGVRIRDLAIFRKLFELAGKLSAVVVGESTERYRLSTRGVEQYWENPADGSPTIVYTR